MPSVLDERLSRGDSDYFGMQETGWRVRLGVYIEDPDKNRRWEFM